MKVILIKVIISINVLLGEFGLVLDLVWYDLCIGIEVVGMWYNDVFKQMCVLFGWNRIRYLQCLVLGGVSEVDVGEIGVDVVVRGVGSDY